MRSIIQRVKKAKVSVDGKIIGEIDKGLLIFLGVERDDGRDDLDYIISKSVNLRVFEDEKGRMNLSLKDIEGEVLVVPQFTLLGDVRKGRRPSFDMAARPEEAERLYIQLIDGLRGEGISVKSGQFQAYMDVELTNDGPVTIMLDSRKRF
ncbi:MAG: D-aminoacyl-tRNA deacylase [Thermodesulfobacteriota bacterium]